MFIYVFVHIVWCFKISNNKVYYIMYYFCPYQICLAQPEGELSFELNDHVILNKESDSWRELPVLKEDSEEMLKGE